MNYLSMYLLNQQVFDSYQDYLNKKDPSYKANINKGMFPADHDTMYN